MFPSPKWLLIQNIPIHRYAREAKALIRAVVLAGALEILGTSVRAPTPWWIHVPPHYRAEVREFAKECGSLCPPLDEVSLVVKDDLIPLLPELGQAIALCRTTIQNLRLVREITIDLRYRRTPLQQKATLWHELIHCILWEDHVGKGDFDLMDPYDRSPSFYEENWDALVQATFCRIAKQQGLPREGCA